MTLPYLYLGAFFILLLLMVCQLYLILKIFMKISKKETELKKEERTLNVELREEIRTTIFLKMFLIRNAVQKQMTNIHMRAIENAPDRPGIDEKMLNESFSANQLKLIFIFWDEYNNYKNHYWKTKTGQLKTVFSGDVGQKTGDVGKMIVASEILVQKLDKLIEQVQIENDLTIE